MQCANESATRKHILGVVWSRIKVCTSRDKTLVLWLLNRVWMLSGQYVFKYPLYSYLYTDICTSMSSNYYSSTQLICEDKLTYLLTSDTLTYHPRKNTQFVKVKSLYHIQYTCSPESGVSITIGGYRYNCTCEGEEVRTQVQ